MTWTPLFAGLLLGGMYSYGVGRDRPAQLAQASALGGVVGLGFGLLISAAERRPMGNLHGDPWLAYMGPR